MDKKYIKVSVIVVSFLVIIFLLYFIINALLFVKLTANLDDNDKKYYYNKISIAERKNFSIKHFMANCEFRYSYELKYNKKGIIFFGDGFFDNGILNDTQSLPYKLSEIAKRPVFDRSVGNGFIQHSILQVKNGYMDDEVKNSDYAVYVLSGVGDLPRLKVFAGKYMDYTFLYSKHLYPKLISDSNDDLKLYETKIPAIKGSFLYRIIEKFITEKSMSAKNNANYFQLKNMEKQINNFYIHLLILQKELKRINPDIKLILLLYWDNEKNMGDYGQFLKEDGIKVISANSIIGEDKITDEEYLQEGSYNPSEKAWTQLASEIARELK